MRDNAKSSKRMILWGGLFNYLHFGNVNPFRHYLTINELKNIGSEALIDDMRLLFSSPFEVYYYGPNSKEIVLDRLRPLSDNLELIDFKKNEVSFVPLKYDESIFLNHFNLLWINTSCIKK